jgi:hypothetical protein
MEWPFRPEDRNWRPPILGRQEIDSPQPLVLPDDAPVLDEPATGEDQGPLPPAQDPGDDQP